MEEERSPQEVIANLEAVLSATAEELEQQKRLNQSLLKRKVGMQHTEKLLRSVTLSSCRISRNLSLMPPCKDHVTNV